MASWKYTDEDDERLPHGMTRVGYDADTQTYTFADEQGAIYEGEPGNRYGSMHPTGRYMPQDSGGRSDPAYLDERRHSDWRYLGPFILTMCLVVLLVWAYMGGAFLSSQRCLEGLEKYTVRSGDTCWDIAERYGTTTEKMKEVMPGLDCERLLPGEKLCVPTVLS